MSASGDYSLLISKLDEFIRKYYKNILIRGGIYALAALLAAYVSLALLEYYNYFDTLTRTVLFYTFIALAGGICYRLLITPALAYYRLGAVISHQKAAQIIGEHFSSVKDRLLNTLELHQLAELHPENETLVLAGINQKIAQLSPIPFTAAINLSENKKYVKYAAMPLSVILIILLASPGILTESTQRLVQHNTFFEKQAPFQFTILNTELEALQNDNFELQVKLSGAEIPQDIYIVNEENTYKLTKENIIQFSYEFKNLQKSTKFHFAANGFTSKEYELSVVPKPSILNFSVDLDYPSYTGKKDETIENTGDLNLPTGTVVTWNFHSSNTDKITFRFEQGQELATAKEEGLFTLQKRLLKSSFYAIQPGNKWVPKTDSIAYSLNVIPDAYPTIDIQERPDSLSSKAFYFIGQVKDDYGFKQLNFNYKFVSAQNQPIGKVQSQPVAFNKTSTQDNFFHYWNFANIQVNPGDVVEYYFEIFDNDGVNGSKSTRSEVHTFKAPTLDEISKQTETDANALKEKMTDALRKAEKFQTESKKLKEKLLDKKNFGFEEKKAVQDLLNKQKELEKLVQEIHKENEKNNLKQQEYKEQNKDIVEKQKELEKLLENVLDEKTKALLDELKKLLEEDNKNKTQEQLEQLQQENKNIEKELDRALELFKQLEVEKKLTENIERLGKLAEKQNQLAEETKNKEEKAKELKEQQDQLNKEFDQLQKDLKELEQQNNDLDQPTNFENHEDQQKEIDKQLDNSSEQLGNGKSQKASQSQKDAAQKMKELAKKMQEEKEAEEEEARTLDLKALRELLENLIKISFDQEQVMNDLKKISTNNPAYTQLAQKQNQLKDDLKMVEDSLFALSKRVSQLQSVVNREIADINLNTAKAVESLTKRNLPEATGRQQYVMTSVNNLAVMLSEVFDQLQQQAKQKSDGNGKAGKKPKPQKGQKPGLQQMGKMQEQLNKQLQEMKSSMKPGQKLGKGQMSEQLAKMAGQQQAIRNALQQFNKEENKDGKGKLGDLDKLSKEMEKTEAEIYNKMITEETLRRQQDIMTRLLEAEKAEREREFDNQREAKEGKQQNINYTIVFEEYKKLKLRELELVKTVPPQLNSYYKQKINTYFNQINQTK